MIMEMEKPSVVWSGLMKVDEKLKQKQAAERELWLEKRGAFIFT